MVFNSAQFLLFLPLAALGYFAVPQKARRPWLLLACYFFYFCWNPAHVPVLAFVTAVGYLGGRLLEGKPRKGVLAAGILLALAPLIGFKYLGFLTKSVLSVLAHLGVQIAPPAFDFLLPMGISFYTLQAVGYLVDTYRGEKAEHNLLDFALFVGFFPQMVSGPISRGNRLLPQLSAAKRPVFDDLRDGVLLLIWGYFLKIVVADRAALFVAAVYAPESEYEGWFYIVATLLFCLQLYGDFGGCSVMAMGTAKILGIDLIDNFNAPYFSQSIAEFWRRWHMTLSRFLRDYLYIPLGGNRHGEFRRQTNLMTTMVLGGLWHGAGWNFVIWGGLHGGFLVINQLWKNLCRRIPFGLPPQLGRFLGVALTFICVVFAWVYFRAPDLSTANRLITGMLGGFGAALPEPILSRLGPLKAFVEGLGLVGYLGGGAIFVETWCWVTAGALIAFFAPNTQEIMGRFEPALPEEDRIKLSTAPHLARAPQRRHAIVMGLILAFGMFALSRPTEFLYFQF